MAKKRKKIHPMHKGAVIGAVCGFVFALIQNTYGWMGMGVGIVIAFVLIGIYTVMSRSKKR